MEWSAGLRPVACWRDSGVRNNPERVALAKPFRLTEPQSANAVPRKRKSVGNIEHSLRMRVAVRKQERGVYAAFNVGAE